MTDTVTTPTQDTKPWWQSRTLWTGALTAISGVVAAAGVLPPFITEIYIDKIVTIVLGAATVIFRVLADKKLTLSDLNQVNTTPQV